MTRYPRTHVETLLTGPGGLNGELAPPPIGDGWRGGPWELVSVSLGPRQFHDDPQSPIWATIAWRRP